MSSTTMHEDHGGVARCRRAVVILWRCALGLGCGVCRVAGAALWCSLACAAGDDDDLVGNSAEESCTSTSAVEGSATLTCIVASTAIGTA